MPNTWTDLLIVGAGPFGLSLSAYARHLGLQHLVVGEPMGFWTSHMPGGMYLRSACDWHLDPLGEHTIEVYARSLGVSTTAVEPLSLPFYLDYARWFRDQKGIESAALTVRRIDRVANGFRVTTTDGAAISAQSVVLAIGFGSFPHIPPDTAALLPREVCAHTHEVIEFEPFARLRVLIIGGRQSAFEWAALLAEADAAAVHVSYRHDTPAFTASDWSWVNPIVDAMADDPGWFRRLSDSEKTDVNRRLWAEGRLKLEPWLAARIDRDNVSLWPRTQVTGCSRTPAGAMEIAFADGRGVTVDRVIFATGYKVDLARVPFLSAGDLLAAIETRNGFPVLDEGFQTSVPGLYMTSMPAMQDFGPFFGFTGAVRTSARLIGDAVKRVASIRP